MSLKLYAPYGNTRAIKVLIAAELANVELEFVDIPFKDFKSPEHLRRHPLGKVPVLETPDGYIYESNAIMRHLARLNNESKLYGENLVQQAQVDQWLDFVSTEIENVFLSLYIPVLGFYPLDHQVGSRAHEELTHKLRVIDNHLKGNNFLVGHSLTIADIHLATLIVGVFRFIYDEQLRKTVPNLVRWFDYVGQLPVFLKHFGRPRNCKYAFPALQITPQFQQVQPQQQPQQLQK